MTALIVLGIIYLIGAIVWALMWGIEWDVNRKYVSTELDAELVRRAARMFLGTPMWPLLAIGILIAVTHHMQDSLTQIHDDARKP